MWNGEKRKAYIPLHFPKPTNYDFVIKALKHLLKLFIPIYSLFMLNTQTMLNEDTNPSITSSLWFYTVMVFPVVSYIYLLHRIIELLSREFLYYRLLEHNIILKVKSRKFYKEFAIYVLIIFGCGIISTIWYYENNQGWPTISVLVGIIQLVGLVLFYQNCLCSRHDLITINDWIFRYNNEFFKSPTNEMKSRIQTNSDKNNAFNSSDLLSLAQPTSVERLAQLQVLTQNEVRRICIRLTLKSKVYGDDICSKWYRQLSSNEYFNPGKFPKVDYWNFIDEAASDDQHLPFTCWNSYLWSWDFFWFHSSF